MWWCQRWQRKLEKVLRNAGVSHMQILIFMQFSVRLCERIWTKTRDNSGVRHGASFSETAHRSFCDAPLAHARFKPELSLKTETMKHRNWRKTRPEFLVRQRQPTPKCTSWSRVKRSKRLYWVTAYTYSTLSNFQEEGRSPACAPLWRPCCSMKFRIQWHNTLDFEFVLFLDWTYPFCCIYFLHTVKSKRLRCNMIDT